MFLYKEEHINPKIIVIIALVNNKYLKHKYIIYNKITYPSITRMLTYMLYFSCAWDLWVFSILSKVLADEPHRVSSYLHSDDIVGRNYWSGQ